MASISTRCFQRGPRPRTNPRSTSGREVNDSDETLNHPNSIYVELFKVKGLFGRLNSPLFTKTHLGLNETSRFESASPSCWSWSNTCEKTKKRSHQNIKQSTKTNLLHIWRPKIQYCDIKYCDISQKRYFLTPSRDQSAAASLHLRLRVWMSA